jgi:hypothetical protein
MASAPVAPAYTGTRAAQIVQYAAWLDSVFPGKISGASDKSLDGQTWGQYYTAIADNPKAAGYSPRTLAEAVQGEAALGKAPAAIAKVIGAEAAAVGATEKGVASASILPGWADPLAGLLGDLTSKDTWLRVAKVVVGSVMIIVGLARITGAGQAAATALP